MNATAWATAGAPTKSDRSVHCRKSVVGSRHSGRNRKTVVMPGRCDHRLQPVVTLGQTEGAVVSYQIDRHRQSVVKSIHDE